MSSPSERARVILGRNPGLLTGPGTNTYLLGGADLLLIDTGAGVAGYAGALAAAAGGEPVRRVLVTHAHSDHMGGVPQVRERYPGASFFKMPWDAEDGRYGVRPEPLADGATVTHGGITLRAIYTPGHAPDHLCFFWEEERVLFSGDLIVGAGTVVIPRDGGDMAAYMRSLERLFDWEIRAIYPGHGPVIEDPKAKIQEYLDHRRMREQQVVEALRAGLRTIPALVARAYADVSPALHPIAEESAWQHLAKLQAEGVVERWVEGGRELYRLR